MFLDLDLLGIGFLDKFDRSRIQGLSGCLDFFGFFQGFESNGILLSDVGFWFFFGFNSFILSDKAFLWTLDSNHLSIILNNTNIQSDPNGCKRINALFLPY